MISSHEPVLRNEVIEYLNPQSNQDFIDGTLGGGGHSKAIMEKTGPKGRLLGFDWDKNAVAMAAEKLSQYSTRTVLVNQSYTQIKQVSYVNGFSQVNGILFDLGLSLDQLQNSGRGFSFQLDEPLDMRFSIDNDLTAEYIVNHYSAEKLEKILVEFGEEKQAKRIVRAIITERKENPIKSTLQLVQIIVSNKRNNPKNRTHPATQTFQALRVAVNHELDNVINVLNDSLELLATGGKLAVISFHSLEDRIVKDFFKEHSKGCICPPEIPVCCCDHKADLKILTKKPIPPTEEEISKNFRARSAKLRVAEKL